MAVVLYRRLTNQLTPEMRAFHHWMRVLNPDEFQLPSDPDPKIEASYRAALEVVNTFSRTTRLSMAQTVLKIFRDDEADKHGTSTDVPAGAVVPVQEP
jgi:hypothetical protein